MFYNLTILVHFALLIKVSNVCSTVIQAIFYSPFQSGIAVSSMEIIFVKIVEKIIKIIKLSISVRRCIISSSR